jgi:hypothetical protein
VPADSGRDSFEINEALGNIHKNQAHFDFVTHVPPEQVSVNQNVVFGTHHKAGVGHTF